MPDVYPILHSVFPSEDKKNVSIYPSQLREDIPIPIKGMFPSSLLNRDLTKLPYVPGLASNRSLGGVHGTTNYL